MPFKKAERTQLYLRCAIFGPSGSGKTMTALRIAKGIADTMGVPISIIDTEARSATKYADRFTFDVDDLKEKTIDHYIASMNEAKEAGHKVLVIDSLSHAWRELTEEVDRLAQSSGSKNTFSPWAKVNPKQKRLIDTILNYPGHIIATMRSKTEWVIGERRDGKIIPEKIGLAPEQGKGIEFEFDLLIEMDQAHNGTITKDRTGRYQDEVIAKPGEDFGVSLYKWLTSGVPVQAEQKAPKAVKGNTGKPKKEDPSTLLTQREELKKEIGGIITSISKSRESYFNEDEKEQARQIIKSTKQDTKGLQELRELKGFLLEELSRREKKAA
jgi:nucleoside-triphosphatase THEP1